MNRYADSGASYFGPALKDTQGAHHIAEQADGGYVALCGASTFGKVYMLRAPARMVCARCRQRQARRRLGLDDGPIIFGEA